MSLEKKLDDLTSIITKTFNLKEKQAKQIISFLIKNKNQSNLAQDLEKISSIIELLVECKNCTILSLEPICSICSSKERKKQLLIVEDVNYIDKMEMSKSFNGKYYVVPILYNRKFELNIHYNFQALIDYVQDFEEIIIAISPTAPGLMTSNLIYETIKKEWPEKNISQLATGISIGSTLDYVDLSTLSYSIKNRKKI